MKHRGKTHYAHVVAYELAYGPVPDGMEVDHIDCVSRACVNQAHLRAATRKQNQENRHRQHGRNTSGVRGVSWSRAAGQWTARVGHNRRIYCAYFHDLNEAAAWAVAKRLELFTHNTVDRRGVC